ncbi:hypothetical protein H7U32_06965 [Bifidobacterium pullorum subsp. saeculare]|uniref:AbiEi antitoxin C-terminal domain-containing protein n=1 Tax=Bifidobacterium pullorum subsp. saeculare TaxID=78257 RepID=A0A938WY65_9BIFI|nr:hypothetical protein [Bifidobacterium pullorum]MBM6700046.1 hypothetical protein [Bifidobacterium pullorum subsp. saeculare]
MTTATKIPQPATGPAPIPAPARRHPAGRRDASRPGGPVRDGPALGDGTAAVRDGPARDGLCVVRTMPPKSAGLCGAAGSGAGMGGAAGPGSAVEAPVPTMLRVRDLPGPLSMSWLTRLGVVVPLDRANGFWSEYTTTLYGRAQIVSTLTPLNTVACALSAAWVWLGGRLPDTVDVLSGSHYRATVHGRRVRVYNRKAPGGQLQRIGALRLTAPARTAVDLAANREDEADKVMPSIASRIDTLMDAYQISAKECLTILGENPYMKTGPRAKRFFEARLPLDEERARRAQWLAQVRKEAMLR